MHACGTLTGIGNSVIAFQFAERVEFLSYLNKSRSVSRKYEGSLFS